MSDIWKDPNVKAALKEGRPPEDIAVLSCPKCGQWGYYNQGSHFYCRKCRRGYAVFSEDEQPPICAGLYIRADEAITLADTVETPDVP